MGLATNVGVHFVSSLAWDRFGQHKLRYILCPGCHGRGMVKHVEMFFVCPRWNNKGLINTCKYILCPSWHGRIWSTQVEMYFVSSLTWEVLGQHELRYILCPRWHGKGLVITCFDDFLSAMAWECLVNTSWDTFCVLTGMRCVCPTHVEVNFVSSLALDGFGQHMLICISCPRWHGRGLVNTSWDAFCFLSFMGGRFGQHMFRYILCARWHGMGVVNTSWDAFYVLAGIGWDSLIQVYKHYMSWLAWEVFGQHKLRYIVCARWHVMGLVNTCWHTFRVLAGVGLVWPSRVVMHFVYSLSLVNTSRDTFCVLAGIGLFGQHMLWCILCPRWHGIGLVNML